MVHGLPGAEQTADQERDGAREAVVNRRQKRVSGAGDRTAADVPLATAGDDRHQDEAQPSADGHADAAGPKIGHWREPAGDAGRPRLGGSP